MKIAYVSAWDLLGQQFNGLQLTHILRKLNIDARMYVYSASAEWPGVIYELRNNVRELFNKFTTYLERQFSSYGLLPIYTIPLLQHSFIRKADIIHLQMIHAGNFFSLLALPLLSRNKTVVLTLHDPWMTTGHCVYPLDCERWKTGCGLCPDLNRAIAIKSDRTAVNWKIKKFIFDHSNIHLIAASQWSYNIIKNSPILSRFPCTIIPLGLNTQIYYPRDKMVCRQKLNIPPNHKVITFRSLPEPNYKGLQYIKEALVELNYEGPVTLITVNSKGCVPELYKNYNVLEMGMIYDSEDMATILGASDLFLMPSIAESFGMMAVEAMACGAVPIVFEDTVLQEVVRAPDCGVAVPFKNSKALQKAIVTLLNEPENYARRVEKGLALVHQEYRVEVYVRRHLELYYSLSSEDCLKINGEEIIKQIETACHEPLPSLKRDVPPPPFWWRMLQDLKQYLQRK